MNTEPEQWEPWVKMPGTAVNVRLVDEFFVRIPYKDDYEFVGPMEEITADRIIREHQIAHDAVEALRETLTPCKQDFSGRPYCVAHSERFPCVYEEARQLLSRITSHEGKESTNQQEGNTMNQEPST